ncbi:hypothetical protein [Bailinhaonella thermotolerans]|uniref:Uncharacterized protein n=1 Tax=Bailinhaonella thermotolerans TaxID=1070861 RepID=A0A3A4AFS0_9ACTN|nr:hypothetical protein [Bailinhaonella thermotolerans]RJL24483.1 hypothetical protein D5H75_29640 [Bailinhaonella thermotolerans]
MATTATGPLDVKIRWKPLAAAMAVAVTLAAAFYVTHVRSLPLLVDDDARRAITTADRLQLVIQELDQSTTPATEVEYLVLAPPAPALRTQQAAMTQAAWTVEGATALSPDRRITATLHPLPAFLSQWPAPTPHPHSKAAAKIRRQIKNPTPLILITLRPTLP